ncbi:metal ABC transporter substrate-binding protein [Rhabdothermincola salaria]|uniref:metal ABC transporter substrate-binding protein n=1 Tax=Rhabdothermincola salaria TaxID=2903142 RepID=UPI001E4E481E|nr:metal ABC transporter substrate-binding protein [Rhabdothermincola salaria]MCD9622885.1 metal ABC transporter substrate-binding protein [Rhabdothermincola salaria]
MRFSPTPRSRPTTHASPSRKGGRRRALIGLGAATALLAAACGSDDGGAAGAADGAGGGGGGVTVVATTTMLGDVTGAIVECAGGQVTTLMSPGVDPHDFAASSAQVAELVRADLVVANGLGLEGALQNAMEGAEADGATVFEVAPLVDPIAYDDHDDHADDHSDDHSDEVAAGDEHDDHADDHADEHADEVAAGDEHDDHADDHAEGVAGDDHGEEVPVADDDHGDEGDHDHGDEDPHFWQDVARMATAVELIGAELAEVSNDPEAFVACGEQVAEDLRALDAEVRALLETVPEDQRVLITDHDAFGYLADAYGFEIAGVVVPGGSTQAAASSQELADLVEVVSAEGVSAIFSNATLSSSLVDALSAEVGDDVDVVELYVDSLGPEGSGADTYAGMMRTNAERIAAALGG